MPSLGRVAARHYYDTTPPTAHRTGDIWSGVPTHGLLRQPRVTGLIVTPSCDLAQHKVETLTYLPILPIGQWMNSLAFRPIILTALKTELRLIQIDWPPIDDAKRPNLDNNDLDALETAIARLDNPALERRRREALDRCRSAARVLRRSLSGDPTALGSVEGIGVLLGDKLWASERKALITNTRPDVHFLPADEQEPDWSGVPEHSLVLFRYPLTAPVEVFDAAQDLALADWTAWVDSARPLFPLAEAFRGERPLKRATVRKEFLTDLLTRFAALYLRIGSPDFTGDTIDRFSDQIQGTR
jgi:hypothetical protein